MHSPTDPALSPPRLEVIKSSLRRFRRLGLAPLIVSAGMPRSGSTLLFNILRELLTLRYGEALSSGWIGDFERLPRGRAYLVKTHELGRLRLRPSAAFYTYRDLRTALVSNTRKFNRPPTEELVDYWVHEYRVARSCGAVCFQYERLVAAPTEAIGRAAETLGIRADAEAIARQVGALRPPDEAVAYSPETLLHPDHITGTGDDEWREALPAALVAQIHAKHRWWFEECGYAAA